MNLSDVGNTSLDIPARGPPIGKSTTFAEADSFIEEDPTVTLPLPPQLERDEQRITIPRQETVQLSSHIIPSELSASLDPRPSAAGSISSSNDDGGAPETPSTRHRRIKVNREVEKIVVIIQMHRIIPCFSQRPIGKDMEHNV